MSAAVSLPAPRTEPFLDLEPGKMHPGVPPSVYHARIPGVASNSALSWVHRSPAHYDANVKGLVSHEGAALAFGTAVHCAVLEPERFATEYAVEPHFGECRASETTTKEDAKANKTRRDAWRAEHAGAILLDVADDAAIVGMVRSLRAHPRASKLLTGGESELTLIWDDAETGLRCRARADYYRRDLSVCIDLKTTEDARSEAFRKSVANYNYHRAAAFYEAGFAACGRPIDAFVFVAIEKKPPFAVKVFMLDDDAIRRGRASIRADIERLAECLELDQWPAYDDEIEVLSLPPWVA